MKLNFKQYSKLLLLLLISVYLRAALAAQTSQPCNQLSFNADTKKFLEVGAKIERQADTAVTIFCKEYELVIDDLNRVSFRSHMVGRIEDMTAAEGWTDVQASWEPWRQKRPEIRARVITPEGKVHELDPRTLTDAPAHDSRPEVYDDDRIYSAPLPGLTSGSIVEVETRVVDTAAILPVGGLRRIYVGGRVPVEQTRIIVESPESPGLVYKTVLLPEVRISHEKENGKERLILDQGPMAVLPERLSNLPSDVPDGPFVLFGTRTTWKAIALSYYAIAEPKIRSEELGHLLDGIVSPADSRETALRKIVALLHREVRYTGVEFGDSSVVPASPGEVLTRKYGDCKDKAALLASMLRSVGIPAELALISAGPGYDTDPELPGIEAFNHVIVHVPGQPDRWIDATWEFANPGVLPLEVQGRRALIIASDTSDLVRTPQLDPAANGQNETIEVFLPEYGPARIVDTTTGTGIWDAKMRYMYAGGLSKDLREGLETYAKNTYLAEAASEMSTTDPRDLNGTFTLHIEAEKCGRAETTLDGGFVVLPLPELIPQFDFFVESGEATSSRPRTADILVKPLYYESRWNIHVPLGFHLRSTPANRVRQLGPAQLTEEYDSGNNGLVRARFRFDTVKNRYTPTEAEAMRSALKEFHAEDYPVISFEQTSSALASQGKLREALLDAQSLVAHNPKEALHHIQLASLSLQLGLGEKARAEGTAAINLEPSSALAHKSYGWILQHDLIGRRFGKGSDLKKAVDEYRKARELDPDDFDTRANLAILLEFDDLGVRYGPTAKLDESIDEYRGIRELKDLRAHDYDVNLMYAMFYAGKFGEIADIASRIEQSEASRSLLVAAATALSGTSAGLRTAARTTSRESDRVTAIADAVTLLIKIRRHPEAAELLDSISSATDDPAASSARVAFLQRTKRYDKVLLPPTDPRSIVQKLFVAVLTKDEKGIEKLFATEVRDAMKEEASGENLRRTVGALGSTEVSPESVLDLVLSNMLTSVEGDDDTGYRISIVLPGLATQTAYVLKEADGYRLLAIGGAVGPLGFVITERLDRGDVEGARKWLDWAREESSAAGGDDPLTSGAFPLLWKKGDRSDPLRMRCAALALLVPEFARTDMVDKVEYARSKAAPEDKFKYDLLITAIENRLQNFEAGLDAAKRLHQQYPESTSAFHRLAYSYIRLKRWTELDALVAERLEHDSADIAAMRVQFNAAEWQADMQKARSILRPFVLNGRASATDLNNYSWDALYTTSVTEDDLDAARRATQLDGNYAHLHTLACIYAELGKLTEARDALLKAMQVAGIQEPDSSIWYGFARIAEQLGEKEVAIDRFRLVERPKDTDDEIYPGDTYVLAQRRLAGLTTWQDEKKVGARR